jgi:COX assembly protein 2
MLFNYLEVAQKLTIDCGDIVKALEECQAQGFMSRAFGKCDTVQNELNLCLRRERLERQALHFKEANAKRQDLQKKWKELEAEEFGPGGQLKQVLATTIEKEE